MKISRDSGLFQRLLRRIEALSIFRTRRIKGKRNHARILQDKFFLAIRDICCNQFGKDSIFKLEEPELDIILSKSPEELKELNERIRIDEKKRYEEESIKRRRKQYSTSIVLIDMDKIIIEKADLDRIQEEIKATEIAIDKLETFVFPDNATEEMKESLIRIYRYSDEYQLRNKTLKAKLEYLKCAYEELMNEMESDRLSMNKRAFDASLDS